MPETLELVPLYEQVKRRLAKMVKERNFKPHQKIPSEDELARDYGINKVTVNKAITVLIHEGLLYRVRGRGTYLAERKTTERERVKLIKVLVPGEAIRSDNYSLHSFHFSIVMGIQNALIEQKSSINLHDYAGNDQMYSLLESCLSDRNIEGIFVMTYLEQEKSDREKKLMEEIRNRGIPVIMPDNFWKGFDFATTDNVGGAYQVTKEVIARSRENFGVITERGIPAVADRVKGVRKALEEHNLSLDEKHILFVDKGNHEQRCSSTRKLIELGCDAIFVVHKGIGMYVAKTIKESGKKVPDEILLCGFDLEEDVFLLSDIPFVSALQNPFEIGRRAAGILIDKIEGRIAKEKPAEIYIPFKMYKKGLVS